MGQRIYKKIGPSHIRELCLECGINPQKAKGKNRYGTICNSCHVKRHNIKPTEYMKIAKRLSKQNQVRPYRKFVKNCCDECGFTSDYLCQFDVDHIDGNHSNNDLDNLRTLCANCHRLKTYLNKDWVK